MCGNRRVLFDNKTVDKWMKSEQLTELLYLVNEVVDKNSGKPYTNELSLKFQVCFFSVVSTLTKIFLLMVILKFGIYL